VVPNYTYGAFPGWPPFLMKNLAEAQKLVDDAEAIDPSSPARPAQSQIDNEKWAIDRLKSVGHLLFPATYTCTAVYWLASYDPAGPWYQASEQDVYDAEH
jgi:hypothetical protein